MESNRTVFLSRFADSSMGKHTDKYTESHDFWRMKTYTKEKDMLVHPRMREFEEPYQVAQKYCGGTWNDYNKPFTIQVGACNLDCYFCFVGDDLKNCKNGTYFTAEDIVKIFHDINSSGVLRISGGEPFLVPEFLKDVAWWMSKMQAGKKKFLWIDTNLLGDEYHDVSIYLTYLVPFVPYGICGCFKGFDESDFIFNTGARGTLFDKQFINARACIDTTRYEGHHEGEGEIFFYIPEITENMPVDDARSKISSFIDRLRREVHVNAPLRTTVLKIKTYPTNEHRMKEGRFETGKTRELWLERLVDLYGIESVWLPQHQSSLRDDHD